MESTDTSTLTDVVTDVRKHYSENNKEFYKSLNNDQSCFKKCDESAGKDISLAESRNQYRPLANVNMLSDSKIITKNMESMKISQSQETRKPHFLDEDYVPPIDSHNNLNSDLGSTNKCLGLSENESISSEKQSNISAPYFPGSSIESLDMLESNPSLSLHHSTWPVERTVQGWTNANHSQSFEFQKDYQVQPCNKSLPLHFHSNITSPEMFGSKVKCVYSLLSMLGSHNSIEMSQEFLEMSKNSDSCVAMRQSGCIPLLVQLVHSDPDANTKQKAALALYNVIRANPDDKSGRREAKVFKLLQQIRDFCDLLKFQLSEKEVNKIETYAQGDQDVHPTSVIGILTKISFDEEHRHAMCDLGALHAIADMISLDHAAHGNMTMNVNCITIRRYAGMALTNLTFGDGKNKSLLCSFKDFLKALVAQLYSSNDELMQASASVLRNMSWRADASSKQILRDAGAVLGLTHAAMKGRKETTLKSILSALWNLSAHCSLNKVDICSVDGALGFLVEMLKYKAPSKTLSIVENAGGILRNVSSHIALREDYREILRHHNCLTILLQQLKSPSLIIVSNACGTLWNLSARNSTDQQFLWENGAVPLLRSLIYSKHKMISMGSSAALKNLLNAKPDCVNFLNDSSTKGLTALPTLGVRKQKSLHDVLDQSLSETCDNIETVSVNANGYSNISHVRDTQISMDSPNIDRKVNNTCFKDRNFLSHSCSNSLLQKVSKFDNNPLNRSESKDSITSAQSDSVYERALRRYLVTIPDYENGTYNNSTTKLNSISLNEGRTHTDKKDGLMSFNEYSKKLQHESKIQFFNVPLRNNYTENDCLETVQDQPIDYSRKYCEQKIDNNDMENSSSSSRNMSKDTFGDYQETDLDQPTDYSLRYGENTSDLISDSEKQSPNKEYYEGQAPTFIHEDSVKCYYTEGTPYETTPYNFSTTTSMTDIRMAQHETEKRIKESPEEKEICDKIRDTMTVSDEKDTCSDYNDAAVEQNIVSKFSSGIGSPEKPVSYCEEGTPGYFSRVSSLSSLDGFNEPRLKYESSTPGATQEKSSDPAKDNKGNSKVVSFVQGPDYAQETPLMFSRSSSLGSLSSIEQPDVIDDHNSVVSDFSRLTSGIVSPSELPDSPTQTIPPAKNAIPPTNIDKDCVATYAEEGTPAHFSCVTSLSALTIEDECDNEENIYKAKSSNNSTGNEQQLVSEGDEEDEDILAACINIGMQKHHTEMPTHSTPKYERKVNNDTVRLYYTEDTPADVSKAASISDLTSLSNELQQFEPIDEMPISKGIEPIADVDDISSDSSNSSNENKDLLGECIQFGMLKPNQQDNKSSPETKQTHIESNYLVSKDEMALYAVEDTPYNFSVCSSISDLTINSVDRVKPDLRYISGSGDILRDTNNDISPENSPQKSFSYNSSNKDEAIHGVGLDHQASHYKQNIVEKSAAVQEATENDARSVQNLHSFSSSSVESFDSPDGESNLFEQCIKSGLPKQKSPSSNLKRVAVRSLNKTFNEQGARKSQLKQPKKTNTSQIPTFKSPKRTPDEVNVSAQKLDDKTDIALLEECIYSGMPKRKSDIGKQAEHNFDSKLINNCNITYDKMTKLGHLTLDETSNSSLYDEVDTMEDSSQKTFIAQNESDKKLDYMQADILSEESKGHNDQTISITNGSEDTYSYDISFPSITCTIPNVVNLEQENDDLTFSMSFTLDESEINQDKQGEVPGQISSNNRFNLFKQNFDKEMSNSSIIEYEASKLASALENCDSMAYSMRLDQIKPPSPMGSMLSLSHSICSNLEIDFDHNSGNQNKVTRNPLPGSLLVRRALNSHFTNNSDNLEQSVNNTSTYNLDSVKPPSAMIELDMDNSINSVASIISEIADSKFSSSPVLQQSLFTNSTNYNFSDIEDINPPSLLSDITFNDNTFCATEETNITLENNESNDSNETPIVNRKSLTPKQNRQLSKERYLTYTLQQDKDLFNSDNKTEDQVKDKLESPSKLKRKTCKQRRQEDRARFQTQILDVTVETPESKSQNVDSNTFVKKSMNQKSRDRERFQTRNLTEEIEISGNDTFNVEKHYDIDNMLAHDADLVLEILENTNNTSQNNETVTIPVSNEDSAHILTPETSNKENKALNTTIEIVRTESKQSESYVVTHDNDLENSTQEINAKPEIVKPSPKTTENIPKVIRPRNKASYVSPYRNISSRQSSRNSIAKPKTITAKQVDSKTVLNSMLSMKPSLSRFTKTMQYKSDNILRKNPLFSNANKNVMNTTITKHESDVKPQPKPLERQGTFTKEETNQINLSAAEVITKKLSSPKKRVSAIPCKLPKSLEPKTTPVSNLRKPLIKSITQKPLEVANKPKTSIIPMKTGIPSREGTRLMPSNLKPPSNLKQPSTKLTNVYKKTDEIRRLSDNKLVHRQSLEMESTNDRKRIQRSQTFDNRATDKCVLAHAAKQKSSIGIRPPQRYSRI